MNRKTHVWFGKGSWKFCNEWKDNLLSLSDLLDNRKQRILNTIRNSEELRGGAIEQLEKARARLRKVEIEADQFRVNKCYEMENYKNKTIQFEQQKSE